MSRALDTLLRQVELWLEPARLAASDPRSRERLALMVPSLTEAAEEDQVRALDGLGALGELIERARRMDSGDTLFVAALFELFDAAQNAVRSSVAARELGDAADLLTYMWLEQHHPVVARVLELLTLYRPSRIGQERTLRPARLEALLTDARGALHHEYLTEALLAPEDPDLYAERVAQRLFGRIAALLHALDVDAVFGITPSAYATHAEWLGDDPAPYRRMLVVSWLPPNVELAPLSRLRIPHPGEGADVEGFEVGRELGGRIGLSLALDPNLATDPPLALLLHPFGSVDLSWLRHEWRIDLAVELGGGVIEITPDQVRFLGTRGLSIGVELEVARISTEADGPALRLGDDDGSRLEIGEVALSGGLSVSQDGLDGTVGFSVSDGAVFIVPQGGFIARVLPPEGLRIAFDLAMSLSRSRGFSFDGAVGLEWRLPKRVQLGPLGLEEMLLALRASTDGPPFEAIFAASLSLRLGPLKASVQDIGLELALRRTESGIRPRFGFKPPVGLGLSIDASAVRGGGFLAFDVDADRYSGVLQLVVRGTIELNALALLETNVPDVGYSLMAAVYSSFPGIPLGMGFTLTGIGGMLALHRTLDPEALVQAVVEGRLDALLFPTGDLVARAPALFSSLRQLFPPAHGRFLFGPFVQLEWARVVTAELGLLLELPAPVRVLVVGRAHVALPESKPILELNLQIMGLLDTERRFFHLQGQLTDSRLLFLHISGGFLLHIGWGRPRRFILSVGGFHPAWVRPEGVLALDQVDRLRIALVSNAVLDVALEGYFAITSNSLQFGGRLSLDLDLRVLTIRGWLAFDALIQWNPVHFDVAVDAGLEVKIRRFTLASVRVLGALSGPNPWRLRGKLKVSILFIRLKVGFDKTFGRTAPVAVEAVRMPRALLQTALSDPDAWSVAAPERTPARLRDLPRHVADPHATLRFEQHHVPLDTPIARADSQDLEQAHRFVADADDVVHNDFALGALQPWTDATRLARPGYTPRPAGARWRETHAVVGAAASRSIEVESVHRARGDALPPTHHSIGAVIDAPPLSTLLATG